MDLMAWLDFGCPWLCSPHGPDAPFSNPALIAIDTIRVLVLVGSALVVGMSIVAARRVGAAQTARFYALVAFALSAADTELVHLGDYASFRLALNITGVGMGVYGLVTFLRGTGASR